MIYGIWEGIVGRVRTQLVAWDLIRRTAEQEESDLDHARDLDAVEVGRRADARALDAKAQGKDHSDRA